MRESQRGADTMPMREREASGVSIKAVLLHDISPWLNLTILNQYVQALLDEEIIIEDD